MDNSNLCNSLIKWLHTFPGLSDVTASSLSDGVQLAKALNIIAPDFFSHQWLSKIKTDVESNWRLKVSNLSKVHQGVVDFYTDHVGTSVQHLKSPDLKKIGEHSDEVELGHLLQLLLGCAINCNDKQRHIEAIMSMEENVQAVIVNAIQDLMSREGSPGVESTGPFSEGLPSYHPHLKSLMEQLESTSIAKEEMDRRCNELDHQISVLVEERNFYKGENEKLKDRVDILEKGSDVGSTRYADLRKQIESLQDELYKVETTRDEYRGRLDELEKIVPDLTTKNEELLLLAEEARSLKDEVDALRGVNDKVGEYEATIETFKRRQEEFSDLRRQVKILEEKNSNYMQNNLELEEEVKKSTALRPQVDLLRKQVTDLHNKLSEETKDKDKLTFDLKKMSEKFEAAVHERDRIQSERFELQKNLEDLKCLSTADSATKSQSDLEDIDPLEILSPAVREKLIRLEHENRSLKKKVSENTDESNPVLQSMFNDLQERFDLLQRENRWEKHMRVTEFFGKGNPLKSFNKFNHFPVSSVLLPTRSASESDLTQPMSISTNNKSKTISRDNPSQFHPDSIIIRHIHEFKMPDDERGFTLPSPMNGFEDYRFSNSPEDTLDSGFSSICRCLSPGIPAVTEDYTNRFSENNTSSGNEGNSSSAPKGDGKRPNSISSESSILSSPYNAESSDQGDCKNGCMKSLKLLSRHLPPPSPTPNNSPKLPHSMNRKSMSRSVKIANLHSKLDSTSGNESYSSDCSDRKNSRNRDIKWKIDDYPSFITSKQQVKEVFSEAKNGVKKKPQKTSPNVVKTEEKYVQSSPVIAHVKHRRNSVGNKAQSSESQNAKSKSMENILNSKKSRHLSFLDIPLSEKHEPFHPKQTGVKLETDSLFTHFIISPRQSSSMRSLPDNIRKSSGKKGSRMSVLSCFKSEQDRDTKLLEMNLVSSGYGAPIVDAESFTSFTHSDFSGDYDPSATEYYTDPCDEEFDPVKYRLYDSRPPIVKGPITLSQSQPSTSKPVSIRRKGKLHSIRKNLLKSKKAQSVLAETINAMSTIYAP